MSSIERSIAVIIIVSLGAGCQQSSDSASNEEPVVVVAAAPETGTRAMWSLYEKLNMRSFRSSFGPRLKHFCESYPFEYFPKQGVQIESSTRMTWVNGDDVWMVEMLAENRVRLEMTISGSGSYHAVEEYDLRYIESVGDFRADADWLEQRADCKPLQPVRTTILGLYDLRDSKAGAGWICGNYWGGRDVTPELERWKSLPKLPHELFPARKSWGTADMLRIELTDHTSMAGRCDSDEQLREVRAIPVFDQSGGNRNGTFVRIATYSGGLRDMMGFVAQRDHGAYKVDFDSIAKEQLVFVLGERDGDWINLAPSADFGAWIELSELEAHVFAIEHLPYRQRLLSADEIKLDDSTPRPVHSDQSDDSDIVYTLSDTSTAMLPIEVRDEWIKVRFVPPPNYPKIGCGDIESDYDWVTGWIRWRDGDDVRIVEEHHYGC